MIETPTRDRRLERRQATESEILEAAWRLAREHGLAGLSLRGLAQEVGMRAPSLYSYFSSKNAIYDAMFRQGAREFLRDQAAITWTGEALRDLQAGLHFFVRFCTDDPPRYQLLFQRTIPGFEPSPESFAVAIEGLEATRSQLVELGIEDAGALDLMTALGTGLTDQQISNDPGGDRWIRLVDEAAEMFLAHHQRRKAQGKKPQRRRR
jgi:AcrR family transcriptional regulator